MVKDNGRKMEGGRTMPWRIDKYRISESAVKLSLIFYDS